MDTEPCRLRNKNGSECGTCECKSPLDCPDPPAKTPVCELIRQRLEEFTARLEAGEDIEATRVTRVDTPDGPMHLRETKRL